MRPWFEPHLRNFFIEKILFKYYFIEDYAKNCSKTYLTTKKCFFVTEFKRSKNFLSYDDRKLTTVVR